MGPGRTQILGASDCGGQAQIRETQDFFANGAADAIRDSQVGGPEGQASSANAGAGFPDHDHFGFSQPTSPESATSEGSRDAAIPCNHTGAVWCGDATFGDLGTHRGYARYYHEQAASPLLGWKTRWRQSLPSALRSRPPRRDCPAVEPLRDVGDHRRRFAGNRHTSISLACVLMTGWSPSQRWSSPDAAATAANMALSPSPWCGPSSGYHEHGTRQVCGQSLRRRNRRSPPVP